ncbi:33496_t:CDS:2, partial [Racocetra persica]
MEEYKRDKDFNRINNSTEPVEIAQLNKVDVDINSIVNRLVALKGHIVKDYSKYDKENDQTNKDIIFNNTNVFLVEFTQISPKKSDEYLKIKLLDDDSYSNIQVFDKRKRDDD